jgi:ABC-2 type transport system permease protein
VTPYLRAIAAAFSQQWHQQLTPSSTLAPLLSSASLAIGVGWIVGASDNPDALAQVMVGAPLMGLWQMGVFRSGWALELERSQGTLDLMMTTRTPLVLIIFGKALSIMASQVLTAIVTLAILLGVAGRFVSVDNLPLLAGSTVLAIAGVVATSFIFTPFTFLVGGRGGFFNAIMPLGTVLSGFLYPTGLLPAVLEVPARLLPTAWAMQAALHSTQGTGSHLQVFGEWLIAASLTLAFLALTALLFRKAETRARVTGDLATA